MSALSTRIGPSGSQVQCYSNFALTGNASVTRALVIVHGTDRNSREYEGFALSAAKKAGLDKQTIVVAPWFKTSSDSPSKGDAVWTNDTWKNGGGKYSSFAAMDVLTALLADLTRFPRLSRIVVAGHSAGGQYVQRYATFGQAPVQASYVVANPSSYCYLDPERPTSDGAFYTVPNTKCRYDDYKYGLAKRTGYVATLTGPQALDRYTGRRVSILNGSKDVTAAHDMDTGCEAMLQGSNRFLRGQFFHRHYLSPTHDRVVIPGVDHDAAKMLASPLAWPSLFGSPTI